MGEPELNIEDVRKLTVEKLKPELKYRGLDVTGKKAELVERLESYLRSSSGAAEPAQQAQAGVTTGIASDVEPQADAAKTHQSIVWQPATSSTPAEAPEKPEAPAQPLSDAAQTAVTEAEKRQARAAKFGTTITQETGKRKLEAAAAQPISTDNPAHDDKQAKRRERFMTQEEKEKEALKTEEQKRLDERMRKFNPEKAAIQARAAKFKDYLGPNSAAAATNGKPNTGNVAAAVNSSLDQSAKLIGKAAQKKGGAVSAATSNNYSNEFKAVTDARKARFAAKS